MPTQQPIERVSAAIAERARMLADPGATSPQQLKEAALEAISLYAPAAERLGLMAEKSRLEHYGMVYGHPDEYRELKQLLTEAEASCEQVFRTFKAPICSLLDSIGMDYTFEYRMKSVYSIWHKMQTKGVEFDDVYDLFATRVVFKPEAEATLLQPDERALDPRFLNPETLGCWRIYTVITCLYRAHPDRIRDWVTHPRPSGYEALQVTVMGPDCNWIELQIRSERMNEIAEHGAAAHWIYKGSTDPSFDAWLDETARRMGV